MADDKVTEVDLDPSLGVRDPALSDDEVIALRSADITEDAAKNGEHRKVFVVALKVKPTKTDDPYDHTANKIATRQYALSQGMRPTDDVRVVSVKPNAAGGSVWDITYAVPVAVEEAIDEASGPDIVVGDEADSGADRPTA